MLNKIMPTTYLLFAILLCVGLHILVPIYFVIPSPWNMVGLIPILIGIWLNLSADRAFKQANTTVKPFEESSALIQDGVFRFSRHPMYLGFVLLLFGISMLLRSTSPYIVMIVFAWFIDRVFIQEEERMLAAQFDEEWQGYKSRVRKWI